MKWKILLVLFFVSLAYSEEVKEENAVDDFQEHVEARDEDCLDWKAPCSQHVPNKCCQPTGFWAYWYEKYECVCTQRKCKGCPRQKPTCSCGAG